MKQHGIDVSRRQGRIDWQQVKDNGVEFAMIRSSASSNEHLAEVDTRLYDNVYEAAAVDLPYGFYHLSTALSKTEAINEADFCIKAIDGLNPLFPVAYDFGDEEQALLSTTEAADLCIAFCDRVRFAGYFPVIRSTAKMWETQLTDERLKKYDKWVTGSFEASTSTEITYNMIQYSDNGKLAGIDGEICLDISYKDYGGLIRALDNSFTYIVPHGETLGEIAEKFDSDAEVLTIINGLPEFNQVYKGRLIKIPALLFNYFVQQGDTLSRISDVFSIKKAVLSAYNKLSDPCVLKSGQVLKVPYKGQKIFFTVNSADTISTLASRYNTTVFALGALNSITDTNSLSVGQALTIPTGAFPNSAAYTVKSNKSVSQIADKFNTSSEILASLNNLADFEELNEGRVILMP